MSKPTVTWLLPVKNGMPFLPYTLASMEAQSFYDWEVLAWDNGSDDGTVEELQRWIPARLPGRILTDRPLGLGASLAAMVEVCETELCARIDADDVNHPERLELQVAFLQQHPEIALVGTQMNRIDENGTNYGQFYPMPTEHDDILHYMLRGNGISHPTVVFRRSAIVEAGNYKDVGEINVEDYDLWLRVAALHKLANLPEALLNYRVHPKSTTQVSIAQNRLTAAMHSRFCEHAPLLFGCTTAEARLLCERKYPYAKPLLERVAEYLQKTQVSPARPGKFSRLEKRFKSPSFIESARQLLAPDDYKTRLWLEWMGKGVGALLPTVRSMAKRSLGRAGIGKLVRQSRKRQDQRIQSKQRQEWFKAQASRGSNVHQSLEFTGMEQPYQWVDLGNEADLERDVTLWISPDEGATPRLSLGGNVYIGRSTYIGTFQPITIGKFALIGAYSYLISANHSFKNRDLPIRKQGFDGAPIVIEDDVWLGTHVVVLPGVTIGEGAIIAAGSLVNKDVPAYEIWGGVPARFLKRRP